MSNSPSFRFRAIGGASVIAMATVFSGAASANAPAPVAAVPSPMVPTAPGNAEECVLDAMAMPQTVTCAPGTDVDGFQDAALDGAELTVEAGAQVQGEINLGANTVATVDGDMVINSASESALDLGAASTVVNNGFVGGDAAFNGFIITGEGSTITNNGTIFNDGTTNGIGVNTSAGSTFTNNGLIAMQGSNVFGVVGENAIVSGNNVTVTNSETGSIIIDGQGALSAGVRLGDDAFITNDGLIQTFGATAEGVLVFDRASVTNNGNIQTSGDGAEGIATGIDSAVTNTGNVTALGNDLAVILVGDNSTVQNDGTISAAGDDTIGVQGGDDLTLTNIGSITAGFRAVDAGDRLTITNRGTIESVDRAINAGDGVSIANGFDGVINTTGDADTIQTGDGTTIFNNGTISNEGFDTKIIDAGDGLRVTNNGTITSDWKGIEGEANFTLINNEGALIFSAFDEAVEADGPGLFVFNDGDIISPEDDAVDGGDNVTIFNTGLIQGGLNDAVELNSGEIFNSGRIISISSDPDGTLVMVGGSPELDAAIDFDTGTPGNEDGFVVNFAGGVIEGDIGIEASPGNVDNPMPNMGEQSVLNAGTITGREGDAVRLGEGFDFFFKSNGGIENGRVDGGNGFDAFIFGVSDDVDRSFDLSLIGTQYINFEDIGFGTIGFDPVDEMTLTGGTGIITLTGTTGTAFTVINTAILDGEATGTVTLTSEQIEGNPIPLEFTVTSDRSIVVDGEDAVVVSVDGFAINNAGSIASFGERAIEAGDADLVNIINSGTIEATDRAINLGDSATIINDMGGLINTTGDADTIQSGENLTIVNNGTISNEGFDTKIIDAGDGLTVTNNGTITSDWKGVEGEANFSLTNNEGALIFSALDEAVEADGPGLFVFNDGEIISPKDDAVDGGADVTIFNTGLIRGGENDGLELDSGTINNSGIIESLSSDPEGAFSDAGFTNRELDAGIDFDGVDDPENLAGPAFDTVTNLEGGIIRGDIGINASSGNFGEPNLGDDPSPANVRDQVIVNFGTITGNLLNPATGRIDAVLLSFGDDTFQQWQTGVTNGAVDGEDGNDTLIFGNNSDTDVTRDLSKIVANFFNFENNQLLAVGQGGFVLTGEGAIAFTVLGGHVTVDGSLLDTISFEGEGSLTVTDDGLIEVNGGDAVEVDVDDFTINNDGTIRSFGERAIDGRDINGLTINNTGLIEAAGENEVPMMGGEGGDTGEGGEFSEGTDDGEGGASPPMFEPEETGGMMMDVGDGSDAIDVSGSDGVTINNSGTIVARANDTKAIDGGTNLTVVNSGIIRSMNGDGKGIEGNAGLTVINEVGGLIEALGQGAEAVEDDDGGLTLINSGTIRSEFDDGVDGNNDANITNNATGLIQGNDNDGLELDSGTVINFGIIESLGSDPEGDFSDIDLTNRELDAGIDFDGGGNDADSLVRNEAGGIIRGDIGINASLGNFVEGEAGEGGEGEGGPVGVASSPANFGNQTVVNFGTITANAVNPVTGRLDAVLLGFGEDQFQQWSGAAVNGWIDLQAGDDTFILEGTSSSVTGTISGGMGNDTAILAGILDSDNFTAFETIQLGSTLGGTLNDVTISGNRTIDGDVTVVGTANFALGVDSLTNNGNLTLEEGSVINIDTPLNGALAGQTVGVLIDNGTFTDNGGTININDDDLLLDYTPIIGSVLVQVSAVNVVADNTDPNINAFGGAVAGAVNAGTLNTANFNALNALTATQFAGAAADALPSLTDGLGREIFETASFAGQALDRHLEGEGSGVWGQFGLRGAEQDALSPSVDGYESDQLIFTVGADFVATQNVRFGVLASYADIENQESREDGTPTDTINAESIKLGVYAGITPVERAFFNAEIGYITGQADTSRSGFFGPVTSDFDFSGVQGRAVLGYDILPDDGVWFTPSVGLNFAEINFDDAQENGGFGFLIERDNASFAELRGGLEAGAQLSPKVTGFVSGTFIHDLAGADDGRNVQLTSAQLGTFATTLALREQDRFELAAGASVNLSETFAIDLGYLGDFNGGYQAHAARATVRIGF